MTNEDLIQKYYNGDKQALSELYEQNIGYLKSTAMIVLKNLVAIGFQMENFLPIHKRCSKNSSKQVLLFS